MPGEESILLRGLEAFAEPVYDQASARELARRPGVSHNFINDRYGSKAAFWRAVMDHALSAQPARLPQGDGSVDDAECLRQIVSGFCRTAADAPLVGRMLVNEFTLDSERLDYVYEHYIAPTLPYREWWRCLWRGVWAGPSLPRRDTSRPRRNHWRRSWATDCLRQVRQVGAELTSRPGRFLGPGRPPLPGPCRGDGLPHPRRRHLPRDWPQPCRPRSRCPRARPFPAWATLSELYSSIVF